MNFMREFRGSERRRILNYLKEFIYNIILNFYIYLKLYIYIYIYIYIYFVETRQVVNILLSDAFRL